MRTHSSLWPWTIHFLPIRQQGLQLTRTCARLCMAAEPIRTLEIVGSTKRKFLVNWTLVIKLIDPTQTLQTSILLEPRWLRWHNVRAYASRRPSFGNAARFRMRSIRDWLIYHKKRAGRIPFRRASQAGISPGSRRLEGRRSGREENKRCSKGPRC